MNQADGQLLSARTATRRWKKQARNERYGSGMRYTDDECNIHCNLHTGCDRRVYAVCDGRGRDCGGVALVEGQKGKEGVNADINKTLAMFVPILRANSEQVQSIEAVHDWYTVDNCEYLKEVAEITYDDGTLKYADIGSDSNLTALYDIIGVIQHIRPQSKVVERIERDVYEKPECDWCRNIEERHLRFEYNWIDDDGYTASYAEPHIVATGIGKYCPNCGRWLKYEVTE